MIACIQRVDRASVETDGRIVGKIDEGLLVLLCIEKGDNKKDLEWMRDKIISLRIFKNKEKDFDKSLVEIGGSLLIISQFTLAGNCDKGRRPDFAKAMEGNIAKEYYDYFIKLAKDGLVGDKVVCGVFGADMKINLTNAGPATFVIEKKP